VWQTAKTVFTPTTTGSLLVRFEGKGQSPSDDNTFGMLLDNTVLVNATELSLKLISRAAHFDSANAADANTMAALAGVIGQEPDDIVNTPLTLVDPATGAVVGKLQTTRRWKAELMHYEVLGGDRGWPLSEKLTLSSVDVTGFVLNGNPAPAEVLALVEAGWKSELQASYAGAEKRVGTLGGGNDWYPAGTVQKPNEFTDVLALAVPPEITDFKVVLTQDLFIEPPGLEKLKLATIEYTWETAAADRTNFTLTRKMLP
jgi:hypothetical protein